MTNRKSSLFSSLLSTWGRPLVRAEKTTANPGFTSYNFNIIFIRRPLLYTYTLCIQIYSTWHVTCPYTNTYSIIMYHLIGYYWSKCKISRTVRYLGHSGVSIEQSMHSNNATWRRTLWACGYRRTSCQNIQNMSIYMSSSFFALLKQHISSVQTGALDSEREKQRQFCFVNEKFKSMDKLVLILNAAHKQIRSPQQDFSSSWSSCSSWKMTDDDWFEWLSGSCSGFPLGKLHCWK